VVSASGNVTGGNLLTGGLISATGTLSVTGATTLTTVSTGNISAGNVDSGGSITTGSLISAVGNVTADSGLFTNIVNVASHTGAVISVTGNVTANNGMFTTIVNTASHTGSVVSVSGNVTGGNVLTGGLISATGNVTGNYFIGNGSELTGISVGIPTQIASGSSNVSVVSSGGNVTVGINGYSNVAVFGTNTLSLGGPFATPKTINSNILVANAVNAILISPVIVGNLGNIFVPDDATLTIFTPA
jgi:hypothetical protein